MSATRSFSQLRDQTSEIAHRCLETGEPIVIADPRRGSGDHLPDMVVMSRVAFEESQARLELYTLLGEAEDDVRRGDQGITVAQMRAKLSL